MISPEGLALKLPNYENAVVSEAKITGYLLSTKHRDGRSKAEFFMITWGYKSFPRPVLEGIV